MMKLHNAICTFALCAFLFPFSASAENWMSRLPDNAYVAVLSIPGTHDTSTGSGWVEGMEGMGDAWARTQETTIPEQWTQGIRAFDMRPCVYEDHLNLNHGLVPTVLHFEKVLQLFCDSLTANPSEFIIIHMLHETDGDQISDAYNARIQEVLSRDSYQPFLADFRRELTVGDMRGKILIISRDKYATKPLVGGFFNNWTGGVDWNTQMKGQIIGKSTANLVMQDYSDTHNSGGIDTKVTALKRLLKWSMEHKTGSASTIRWVFNFASAYSKIESIFGFEVSTSDGYRDNATYTHETIIDFLKEHKPGPTGIILMDYAGVDETNGYKVRGREAVQAIIDNNFGYLSPSDGISAPPTSPSSPNSEHSTLTSCYSLSGQILTSLRKGQVNIVRLPEGRIAKFLIK